MATDPVRSRATSAYLPPPIGRPERTAVRAVEAATGIALPEYVYGVVRELFGEFRVSDCDSAAGLGTSSPRNGHRNDRGPTPFLLSPRRPVAGRSGARTHQLPGDAAAEPVGSLNREAPGRSFSGPAAHPPPPDTDSRGGHPDAMKEPGPRRRRSVIVRMTPAGERLSAVRIVNDPVTLGLEIAKAGPDPDVVLEATYGWYWAADVLTAASSCGPAKSCQRQAKSGPSGRTDADEAPDQRTVTVTVQRVGDVCPGPTPLPPGQLGGSTGGAQRTRTSTT
jgi:hypothetical protein